ncbi:MAG: calcium/sodium antiporter [Myxococcales bacterium]|nr:calcium/sodium antiporter [Myxococcales bacterium]
MTMEWLRLLGGGLLLYFGAEWFVGGASALALALRVPQILVGLTVVAYGTSAPEIIVGVEAAGAGYGDVAIGNVVGSNVANVGLILGVTALVSPPRVDPALRRRELPVLVLSAASLPLLFLDGVLSRVEASGLLVIALLYTSWMVRAARASAQATARVEVEVTAEVADAAGAPKSGSTVRSGAIAAGGLVVLLIGGSLFVDGAVSVAKSLGMSERLVGLTIVAVGTSLPELITSTIAARRGHSDIAIGNVVGSNIFNVLLCLGAAGLTSPLRAPLADLSTDLVALGVITVLAAAFIRTERHVSRTEGLVALALYGGFTVLVIARG